MSRITITLDEALYQALKETAARQRRSITKIVEESLILRGIKPTEQARDLVARARKHAKLSDGQATQLAVTETRLARKT